MNVGRENRHETEFARRMIGNGVARNLDSFERNRPPFLPHERARSQGNHLATIECSVVVSESKVAASQEREYDPRLQDL